MFHAIDATGGGGGGKKPAMGTSSVNEGVEALTQKVKNHPFHVAATPQ
jgi:hypothetical protein